MKVKILKGKEVSFNGECTATQADAIVEYAYRLKESDAALNDTIEKVCAHYAISRDKLFSKNRDKPLALARHLCVYRLVHFHNYHKSKAARIFFKNHSSAYNSLMRAEKELMEEYGAIFSKEKI